MTRHAQAELFLHPQAAQALADGSCGDPFALLGPHAGADGTVLRAFVPGVQGVDALIGDTPIMLAPIQVPGLFAARLPRDTSYRLRLHWDGGAQETRDPYAFGPLLSHEDLELFSAGLHPRLGSVLGAHAVFIDGVDGVRFAVWAPNARRVSVIGDFNAWDGRRHPMRKRVEAGVWELFVPALAPGDRYQYELLGAHGRLPAKSDPVAWQLEAPPCRASIVADPSPFAWSDAQWIAQRGQRDPAREPISIYELHTQSWRRDGSGSANWSLLERELIPYVQALGFTHIELLPVSAYPFGGSWGYQPLGLYAPHAPLGTPQDLMRFVDACHASGIGVIVDWVPAHFPTDSHGLAHFDGSALYEHADPREGFHQDWNTLIYNLGRREVCAHLIGSALHWLEHFHIDGLRVDAVASMLYRDYSRRPGEWVPNVQGGRENFESVRFLKAFNDAVHRHHPGVLTIAEESTAWPGVTSADGLGFDFKWNMGWMHDSLRYVARDPVHRSHAHDDLTFGLVYAFSERFVLPLSHDEVVHGKGSLFGRMPGDAWQRFATLRAYLAFMWAHPGKKLLFMGGELAQFAEWNHDSQLDWNALLGEHADAQRRRGVQRLVGDLNRLLRNTPSLHAQDADPQGFEWIVGDDRAQSAFVFCRHAPNAPPLIAAINFTPVPRERYRIGVPRAGRWIECLNTDALDYAGSGIGNFGGVDAQAQPSHGHAHSVELRLPPLATLWLTAHA